MRLSFAKEKRETGLAGVARPTPNTAIKLDGCWAGIIRAPTWRTADDHSWTVSVMVAGADSWRWVAFKTRHSSESEARQWFRRNLPAIQQKYNIRLAPRDES